MMQTEGMSLSTHLRHMSASMARVTRKILRLSVVYLYLLSVLPCVVADNLALSR